MKQNNSIFADKLCQLLGGYVHSESYRSCIWQIGNENYLVRSAKKSIIPRIPTSTPVDGIVFYLSDFKCWGIADFSKKTLGRLDATMGYLDLNIT